MNRMSRRLREVISLENFSMAAFLSVGNDWLLVWISPREAFILGREFEKAFDEMDLALLKQLQPREI